MAMPAQPTEWTVEMVRALPDDGNRYEVIDGESTSTVRRSRPTSVHARIGAPFTSGTTKRSG